MRLAIVVLVAACSASHQPVPSNVAVDTPARPPAPPTLATAGAKSCVLRDVVLLGPHGEGNAAVGFDRTSGIAAWKREPGVLAAVAIGFDGKPRGAVATMPVAEGVEPHGVRATVAGFVVLLRRWNIDAQRESWWTVAVDRDARMHPPVTVPAEPATPPQAAGPDDLEVSIVNAATPPPPGPGGRIYEPMGRPVLERMHRGQRAGDPIHLEFHGNPIANGMNISTDLVWSGSHFIYPFWNDDGGPTHDKYAVFLLPIDCRPQPLPSSSSR